MRDIQSKNRTKYLFILLIAAICLKQYGAIINDARPAIKKFLKAQGSHSRLRRSYPTFATTTQAKELISPGSSVAISYLPSAIENIAAQYNLYPLELSADGDYLIDLARSIKDPSTSLNKYRLSTGIFVFSKNDFSFVPTPKPSEPTSAGKSLFLFIVIVIFETLLGLSLLNLFGIPRQKTDGLWRTATGYLIGFCVSTTSLWLLLLGGAALNLQTLMKLALGLSVLFIPLFLKSWTKTEPSPCVNHEKIARGDNFRRLCSLKTQRNTNRMFFLNQFKGKHYDVSFIKFVLGKLTRYTFLRGKKSLMEKSLLVLVVFLTSSIILWIISSPIKDWDTMTNWILKSKILFHKQNLDLAYTYTHHNSYPILWPLHVAAMFTIFGGDYDEAAVWSSALFFLIFLIQLSKGFSLTGIKPVFVYLSLLIYLAFFISENPTTAALPENAFLCFLTALIVTSALWIESPEKIAFGDDLNRFSAPTNRYNFLRGEKRSYLSLSIILAAGLNLLKLEGAVTTAILIFSLIIIKRKVILTKTTGPFFAMLLLTTLLPVLWIQWSKAHGLSGGIDHLAQEFSRDKLLFLGKLNAKHFFRKGELLILLLAAGYLVFFPNPRKWNASEKFLLILFILLMGFKWTAMLGWNKEMMAAPGVFSDGAWRLFLHTTPALILLFSSRAFRRT